MGKRVQYVGDLDAFAGMQGDLVSIRPHSVCVRWDDGREAVHSKTAVIIITKAEESASDPVNQPQHYQFFPDLEAIEVIARSTTQEQFYGYCLGNRLKYRLRAGNKDKLEQDIAKSDKYLELYERYKGLCYGSGDDVITPVPMPNLEDW